MVTLLSVSCTLATVAIAGAMQLTTNRIAAKRTGVPGGPYVLSEVENDYPLQSVTLERHIDLRGTESRSALVVVVIASDQLDSVRRSMSALGDRVDWMFCAHARVDDATLERLREFSTNAHDQFGISIKTFRPLNDTSFVPKQVFWSKAFELDKAFVQEHDNLWLVDSDINFEGFDLNEYMLRQTSAYVSDAPLISQPIIKQNTQYFLYWNNHDLWQQKHPDVPVAHSALVEFQAAMVNAKFFIWLLDKLSGLVSMQQQLRSDWIFDDVWCGAAAMYLETVEYRPLAPGTSPCAIITLPISHEDDHSIVKDARFDEQNHLLKDWALNEATNTPLHDVLERQQRLVREMQLFTPWPDQQCDACSVSQCKTDEQEEGCCWIDSAAFSSNNSCSLTLAIADSRDITQVVSPAAINNRSYNTFTPSGGTAGKLFNWMKSSLLPAADIGVNLKNAFSTRNAALFIIAMPERQARMMRLAQDIFGLPRERIVLVPGIPKQATSDETILVSRGVVTAEYFEKARTTDTKEYNEGRKLSPGRVACYLAHMRAHRMFIESTFNVALFLEDDIDAGDVESPAWQQKAHTLFTSDVAFGQPGSADPVAVYLGYCFETCPAWAHTYELDNNITLRDADKPMCTHAYATNRKASEMFLKGALPMDDPVDWVMPKSFKAGKARILIVNPPMLWQRLDMDPIIGGEDESKAPFCNWYGCNCDAPAPVEGTLLAESSNLAVRERFPIE
jgi:GR25 family glycosyltransferase involved in LPS biosynthesis